MACHSTAGSEPEIMVIPSVSEWAEPESTFLNAAPVGYDRAASTSGFSTHHTTQGTGTQGKTRGQDPGPVFSTKPQRRNAARFSVRSERRSSRRFPSRYFSDISVDPESEEDQTSTRVSTLQNYSTMSPGICTVQDLPTSSTAVTTLQAITSSPTAISSASLSCAVLTPEITASSTTDLPPTPRRGCRVGDDDIGYLSAHPVSASVKGPCHVHEGINGIAVPLGAPGECVGHRANVVGDKLSENCPPDMFIVR